MLAFTIFEEGGFWYSQVSNSPCLLWWAAFLLCPWRHLYALHLMAGPAVFCSTFKLNASKRKLNSLGNAQLPLPMLLSSRVVFSLLEIFNNSLWDKLSLLNFMPESSMVLACICVYVPATHSTSFTFSIPLPGVSHGPPQGKTREWTLSQQLIAKHVWASLGLGFQHEHFSPHVSSRHFATS